jgi:hypothetical protein
MITGGSTYSRGSSGVLKTSIAVGANSDMIGHETDSNQITGN